MRGGAPALEQSRLGQDERAGAQRDDATSTCVRAPERIEYFDRELIESVGRGDNQGVDSAGPLQPVRRLDPKTAVGGHRGAAGATDGEPVPGDPEVGQVGVPEHVAGHSELEHPYPVVDDDRHLPGRANRHPLGWIAGSGTNPAGHGVGSKVAHCVNHATFGSRRGSAPWCT